MACARGVSAVISTVAPLAAATAAQPAVRAAAQQPRAQATTAQPVVRAAAQQPRVQATAAQPVMRAAAQQPRVQATALSAVSRRLLADSVHAGSSGSVNMQDYALSDYFAEDYVGVFFLF